MLLQNFFLLLLHQPNSVIHNLCPRLLEKSQLPKILFILEKIRHILFEASPLKKSAKNDLPALTWQKL